MDEVVFGGVFMIGLEGEGYEMVLEDGLVLGGCDVMLIVGLGFELNCDL